MQRRISQLEAILNKQDPVAFVMGNVALWVCSYRRMDIISTINDDRGGPFRCKCGVTFDRIRWRNAYIFAFDGVINEALGAIGGIRRYYQYDYECVDRIESAIQVCNEVIDTAKDVIDVVDSLKNSSYPLADLAALSGVLCMGLNGVHK